MLGHSTVVPFTRVNVGAPVCESIGTVRLMTVPLFSAVTSTGFSLPLNVTFFTRSRFVPLIESTPPALTLFVLYDVTAGLTRVNGTATLFPLAMCRVKLPSTAFSGTGLMTIFPFSYLKVASTGSLLMLSILTALTTSRSLPLIVSVSPALTGAGEATHSVGMMVTTLPTGTSTPDVQTMLKSPSGAVAGRVNEIVLLSSLSE